MQFDNAIDSRNAMQCLYSASPVWTLKDTGAALLLRGASSFAGRAGLLPSLVLFLAANQCQLITKRASLMTNHYISTPPINNVQLPFRKPVLGLLADSSR